MATVAEAREALLGMALRSLIAGAASRQIAVAVTAAAVRTVWELAAPDAQNGEVRTKLQLVEPALSALVRGAEGLPQSGSEAKRRQRTGRRRRSAAGVDGSSAAGSEEQQQLELQQQLPQRPAHNDQLQQPGVLPGNDQLQQQQQQQQQQLQQRRAEATRRAEQQHLESQQPKQQRPASHDQRQQPGDLPDNDQLQQQQQLQQQRRSEATSRADNNVQQPLEPQVRVAKLSGLIARKSERLAAARGQHQDRVAAMQLALEHAVQQQEAFVRTETAAIEYLGEKLQEMEEGLQTCQSCSPYPDSCD